MKRWKLTQPVRWYLMTDELFLMRGDLPYYRMKFLEEKQYSRGNIQLYICEAFEEHLQKCGGLVSVSDAYTWISDKLEERVHGGSLRTYRRNWRLLFTWICGLHGVEFKEPVCDDEIVIHYNMDKGIL